jgi:hypothetical protein
MFKLELKILSMKKFNLLKSIIIFFTIVNSSLYFAQPCVKIESILVSACSPPEGSNEWLLFSVGNTPLNTDSLDIQWGSFNNNYFYSGLIQNETTANIVAQFNTTTQSCGILLEPINGVLPANSKVIIFTGTNTVATAHSFEQLNDTLWVIFQNATLTGGYFLNYTSNAGTSQFTRISFSGINGCSSLVTFFPFMFGSSAGGSIVHYDENMTASYENTGCIPSFDIISANWNAPESFCVSDSPINLNSLITGTTGGTWSGNGVSSNGMFNPSGLSGAVEITYTVGNGQCAATLTNVINISTQFDASWTIPNSICSGQIVSLNELVTGDAGGTWSGQGVVGSNFNSSGLLGNVSITYAVGTGDCASTLTQEVFVIEQTNNASWTIPANSLCQGQILSLNPLITGAEGGTWSGQGVSGSNFNTSGLSGDIAISYNVGTGICQATSTQNINVIQAPSAGFEYEQNSGYTVEFSNTSVYGSTYLWDFGGGNFSNQENPQYIYPFDGFYFVTLIVTNDCGSDTITINIEVKKFVSIHEITEGEILVYPNPVSNVLFIQFSEKLTENLELNIYNAIGQRIHAEILSEKNNATVQVDMTNLSNGFYILNLRGKHRQQSRKIMLFK